MMVFKEVNAVESKGLTQADSADAWATDNHDGRTLARAYLDQARIEENPLALVAAIRRMVQAGRWTGVEVGFVHALCETLI